MKVELEVISDVIGLNNKVVIRDMTYKKVFELDEIEAEEFISNKGKVVKKYCTVTCENKFYKVNKPYSELASLLMPTVVKGFYSKTTTYEKENKQKHKSRERL